MHAKSTDRLVIFNSYLPEFLRHPSVFAAVQAAFAEDLDSSASFSSISSQIASGDITSLSTIPPESTLNGRIIAKASGVIAGLPLVNAVFHLADERIQFFPAVHDGEFVQPGTLLADIQGPGLGLLAAERTALNFLGRMSGIASLTQKYVEAIKGTGAVLLDTRKTAPGLRYLDKYAVRMGGGQNHRIGLFDMVMIKDNHIDGAGGIEQAVLRVRQKYGDRYLIEVEVKDLEELHVALGLKVDRIMLDNMSIDTMRKAVLITAGITRLEASGNVTLQTIRAIAETGVDYISSGALTHSAPVLDISMRLL